VELPHAATKIVAIRQPPTNNGLPIRRNLMIRKQNLSATGWRPG
jgi:hypothetical protein